MDDTIRNPHEMKPGTSANITKCYAGNDLISRIVLPGHHCGQFDVN